MRRLQSIFSVPCAFLALAIFSQFSLAQTSSSVTIVDPNFVQVPHDKVPRFANIAGAGSVVVTNIATGNFSDGAIWQGGVVPGVEARVQIADGTTVTYDLDSTSRLDCIEVHGTLAFATDRSTKLYIDELMVMPNGELIIGSVAAPIGDDFTAEIVFRGDTDLKTGTIESPGTDPRQYGKGLLVFGKVRMYGRQLDETYLRFTQEPLAGELALQLEAAPVGWGIGDRLIIPDTRQIQFTSNHASTSQGEEVEIAAIAGNSVTLTAPLAYDHRGPRDVGGNVGPIELSMLPHVGNLTRNIILRSENPEQILRRGHTIYFHRADIDMRYAAFVGLGRTTIATLDSATFDGDGNLTKIGTNQIGRYSIHMHHIWGPHNPTDTGYQLQLIGTVMDDMRKWGLTVHDTHYGLIRGNIAYGGHGSAIATEDGNESYNVFEKNFVVHTKAGDTQPILGHSVGRGGVFNTRRLFGTTRDAFWFSGEFNYVRDNVAANTPDFAFNYNGYYIKATMRVPKFRGADMNDPDEYFGWNYHGRTADFVEGRDMREGLPVLESARNEVYSSGQGLWLTWARGCCSVSYYKQESLFEDYRLWHINHTGVYAFHESRNTYSGFILRNDPAVSLLSGPNLRLNRGCYFGNSSYENGKLILRDFDIQGFNVGLVMPPNPQDGEPDEDNVTLIENGVLKNHINIEENFPTITDGKVSIIRNVQFTPTLTYQSNALPPQPVNILMDDSRNRQMHPMRPSQTFVYDFNGVSGDSFQVFWDLQAPDAIVPPAARPDLHADDPWVTTPIPGLTNAESLQQFGIVTAGEIAPCVEIDGGDCSISMARAASKTITGLVFPLPAEIGTDYSTWRTENFDPAQLADDLISGSGADPEGDGLGNLLEYALALDPWLNDAPQMEVRPIASRGLTMLTLPKNIRTDIAQTIEVSDDLSTWRSDPGYVQIVDTFGNGDGTESHLVQLIQDYEESPAIFFRIGVELVEE